MVGRSLLAAVIAAVAGAGALGAQTAAPFPSAALEAGRRVAKIQLTAKDRPLTVGDTVAVGDLVSTVPLDSAGQPVEGVPVLYSISRGIAVLVGPDSLAAISPGSAALQAVVLKPTAPGQRQQYVLATAPLAVRDLPPARVEIVAPDARLYVGTTVPFAAHAYAAAGRPSEGAVVTWSTSNPAVATVDRFGNVTGVAPGAAAITAKSGAATATQRIMVRRNTIAQLRLTGGAEKARTGDVVRFQVSALDAAGKPVPGVMPLWSVTGTQTGDDLGARVWHDGAFVAEEPGIYTVVVTAGPRTARATIEVEPRHVAHPVRLVGRAIQTDHSTSELHVWTAKNGRDYAYVGTHAAGSSPSATGNVMFAYDVTDPAKPVLTDSVIVNARVINDILVNDAGTLGVLTREGAADRKNGLVVLDVSDPAHPKILSEYTDSLTGGIHNTWFYQHVVYVTNDGTSALHIIDISDPKRPKQVGRWETGNPEDRYLHDVWVHQGIMYLSYWNDGVQILDVGGLGRGGTPEKPVFVSKYAYPIGNTHNVWRDRNYLFIGDEIFGCAECVNGPRGYVHVVDLTDIDHPVEVGKFEVPEAGTHNMWAEDGKLYIAYYQGGLRVVDITGELRGDLYRQGRQIGYFHTADSTGFVPNSPMAWGPQPHKGNVFVSDMHSGLWVVKLDESRPLVP